MDGIPITTTVTLRAHKNRPGSASAARIADDGSRKFLAPHTPVSVIREWLDQRRPEWDRALDEAGGRGGKE